MDKNLNKVELAQKLHREGYNCAQSVACVFADELGMDASLLYKMAEGFGGGLGCAKGQCGALSGAALVAGLLKSDGDTENPGGTKKETTAKSREMLAYFKENAQAIICYDIKGAGSGVALTSCPDCIRIGVEAVIKVLGPELGL